MNLKSLTILLTCLLIQSTELRAQEKWDGLDNLTDLISRTGPINTGAITSTGLIQSSQAGIRIGSSTTAISSDGLSLYLKSGGHTYLNTNSNVFIRNSGGSYFSGDMGIGIQTPTHKLHIWANAGILSRLTVANPSVGSYGASLDFTMGSGADYAYAGGLRAYVPNGQPGVDRVFLGFYTTTWNSDNGLQSRVERLTVSDKGNVGIGIPSPQYKLHVAGSGFFQQRLTVQGDIPNDNNAAFWNNSNTGYGFYSQGGAGGRYSFHFLNKEGNTIMYGKGDGNIGIGTTYPDAKLAVKGTIHAEEVKVDLNVPGPDYVFEPAYQLPTLTEIESYIKANKHLPEVPSAKEMETNGINLSEMNMLLLKKVEELTLYVIELKKENKEIKEEIKQMKNEK